MLYSLSRKAPALQGSELTWGRVFFVTHARNAHATERTATPLLDVREPG